MVIFPAGWWALQRGFNYFSKAIPAIAPPLILWSLSFSFFDGGNEWGENSLYFIRCSVALPGICISYSNNQIREACFQPGQIHHRNEWKHKAKVSAVTISAFPIKTLRIQAAVSPFRKVCVLDSETITRKRLTMKVILICKIRNTACWYA